MGVVVDGVADLTVSGDLGLARIVVRGDVVVTTNAVSGDFGLTGDLEIDYLGAGGFDRLDSRTATALWIRARPASGDRL